jgi:hypothetical protein
MKGKKPIPVLLKILGLILVAGLGWLAVRYFVGLRKLGYVDSAIGTMRTLVGNENKFAVAHPAIGFTCKLADIESGTNIANGRKNEYVFEIRDCEAAVGNKSNATYRVTATPLLHEMPAFCSDQSGILKADYNGSAIECMRSGQPL